jgi:hypothetical protein
MTNRRHRILIIILFLVFAYPARSNPQPDSGLAAGKYPKIANWLAKKAEVIQSKKPYDLVMSGWFTPDEAQKLKAINPKVKLLAGLSFAWVWDNPDWMKFLKTVANYGRKKPLKITNKMYLKNKNGKRTVFGWASKEWGHEEIYGMDPRNPGWVDFIVSFYKVVLEQPQHDGIIVDMVSEKQWWCDAITDQEWLDGNKEIMARIKQLNTQHKTVIFNSGFKGLAEIDEYTGYFDGYLMENFLGESGAGFLEGLNEAKHDYTVIYAVDTDDTGTKDLKRMRLGYTLSLLNDNTFFTYDFGPRDHGQAWWFPEYDADLGAPVAGYYSKENAYWREFQKGMVVCAPNAMVNVTFNEEYTDATTGTKAKSFTVLPGDGRIFLK